MPLDRDAVDADSPIRERYEKLLQHLDAGFCVVEVLFDAAGNPVDYCFLEANAAFVDRTGLDDAVGKRMRELRPNHEDLWFERYGRVALTGESMHFEADAQMLGRSYDVYAFRVDAPEKRHVAILFRDTTHAKLVEHDREDLLAAERAARAEAEEAARAKSEFLAVMSHELRTPINAFIGYVQLLEMEVGGPITEQQRSYLARMATSATHLLNLVGGVLDLAKVDAGELNVVREHAYTGTAVDAALALMAPQADARGITLLDHQVGTQGVPYVGDEQRVQQILANLLSNAVKFTDRGGRIEVGCRLVEEAPPGARVGGGGPWAAVTVNDTGVGIAVEDQERVFEEFHQVESGRTRTQGGTGLGLAISRRLARLMGGDLTVESAPGVGSAFTLWLPASGGIKWGVDGAPETAAARGARAHRAVAGFRTHSCAEVGAALRADLEALLSRYVARLRTDALIAPVAQPRTRAELEDHMLSYLGDLCQALVIADENPETAADLARDGTAIQRTVAELHGRQRQQFNWSERQLLREHELLLEEIRRLMREQVPEDAGDIDSAMRLVTRVLERAADNGLGAHRRAAQSLSRTKPE